MAKKSTTSRKDTTTPATEPASKAQAIRDFHRDNPDAGPKEIATALTKQGIEVNAGRVSSVLRTGGSKVDVETVKLAAEFVGGYDGSIEEAFAAIENVGGFVESCGGAEKAKAALGVYQSVAEAVK